jgi:enoyl-CoA hydratase/carnithine racemase
MCSPTEGRAFATIAYEVADAIATVTLDRPDRLNALDPTMERELLGVWDLVDADDAVRAVVVTGRGRAFCAGADLSDEGAGFDVVPGLRPCLAAPLDALFRPNITRRTTSAGLRRPRKRPSARRTRAAPGTRGRPGAW